MATRRHKEAWQDKRGVMHPQGSARYKRHNVRVHRSLYVCINIFSECIEAAGGGVYMP